MTKFIKKILAVIVFVCCTVSLQAQTADTDVMRSNGKIYVVVAVCLTILIGLFLYVFSIDRKISKWEKEK
jgi:protein-S-isoprenylcysteine O-methyltransferase Ste14